MGWLSKVVFLVTLKYISQSSGSPNTLPLQEDLYSSNTLPDVDSNIGHGILHKITDLLLSKRVKPSSVYNNGSDLDNKLAPHDPIEDVHLQRLSSYLSYILVRPWPTTGLPLLYVEDYPEEDIYPDQEASQGGLRDLEQGYDQDNEISQALFKRSRYYRKYPWKRQNSKETYEAENRYLCQPSKDDVFRLLVALHEARQGNRGHTINFCNRKRPASAIFTNIRFLGRRK